MAHQEFGTALPYLEKVKTQLNAELPFVEL